MRVRKPKVGNRAWASALRMMEGVGGNRKKTPREAWLSALKGLATPKLTSSLPRPRSAPKTLQAARCMPCWAEALANFRSIAVSHSRRKSPKSRGDTLLRIFQMLYMRAPSSASACRHTATGCEASRGIYDTLQTRYPWPMQLADRPANSQKQ